MAMYRDTSASVRIQGASSCPFPTSSGVLQGDTLAPFLFVLILDAVIRDAQLDELGYTVRRQRSPRYPTIRLPPFCFADDMACVYDSHVDAQEAVTRLYHSAKKVGLDISATKTEVLTVGLPAVPIFLPNGEALKTCEDFVYLGSKMANPDKAISQRRGLAWTAAHKLAPLFHAPVSDDVKLRLFRAAITPVLLYGLEAMPLTNTRADALDAAHRALARFALGIHYPEVVTNAELARLGVSSATDALQARRDQVMTRIRDESALKIVLAHPPTEMLRRGMSNLKTLRDELD